MEMLVDERIDLHPQVMAARDYLRLVISQRGITGTELARQIKVSASTINKPISKNPAESPTSIKTLNKVLKWSGVPFTKAVIEAYDLSQELMAAPIKFGHETVTMDYDYPASQAIEPDLKVLGVTYCGSAGDFAIDHSGDPIDYVRRAFGCPGLRTLFGAGAEPIGGAVCRPTYSRAN